MELMSQHLKQAFTDSGKRAYAESDSLPAQGVPTQYDQSNAFAGMPSNIVVVPIKMAVVSRKL